MNKNQIYIDTLELLITHKEKHDLTPKEQVEFEWNIKNLKHLIAENDKSKKKGFLADIVTRYLDKK